MLKKMKKYIAVLLTVTLICSFGLTGCGTNSVSNSKEATAENPMVLTLAHGLSESHTVHIAMLQFAEEVKQKTNGRIIIKANSITERKLIDLSSFRQVLLL